MIAELLPAITRAIDPVARIIDAVHTSDEEKQNARNRLFGMQADLVKRLTDYEGELARSRARIIEAEAKGQVLQRIWRPLAMLTFLVLVVCDAFGFLAFRLAAEAWTLLQLGMGGYVVGRTVEKVAPGLLGPGRETDR